MTTAGAVRWQLPPFFFIVLVTSVGENGSNTAGAQNAV